MRFLCICLALLPVFAGAQVNFTSSNLPIVVIQTNGQSIPDEPKLTAQMQVRYNGPGVRNYMSDQPKDYNGLVGIEVRGSTSALFSDKKPYSVELRDADGDDLAFPLLGMPAESDWAFLAPYNDKSLVRDALMHELARHILPWSPRMRYVELVLNGQYQGIYIVTEKIKRDKNRVDVAKLKASDVAGDSLTGGYILKIDKTTGSLPGAQWVSPYPPFAGGWQNTVWQVDYPNLDDIQPEQQQYINDWIDDFETAMYGTSFADTALGYPKYLDVPSFVDFTLLNEVAKNVDSYRLSTYFWKDRDDNDPRLHAGPIWDFNIALGNADYCNGQTTSGWAIDFNNVCPGDSWVNQFWWQKMWLDQQYRRKLKTRWFELRQTSLSTDSILHVLDSLTSMLSESQTRNFQRWPILNQYVWPNPFCCGSYSEHTTYLRNWIQSRLTWMDIAAKNLYVGEYVAAERFETRVTPNPNSGQLTFNMYLRYNDLVQIHVYDALGNYMAFLPFDPEENGESQRKWEHNLRPGVYFYKVIVEGKLESGGRFIVERQ
jgi:CotH kinase protein